jgi:hypothetical protein
LAGVYLLPIAYVYDPFGRFSTIGVTALVTAVWPTTLTIHAKPADASGIPVSVNVAVYVVGAGGVGPNVTGIPTGAAATEKDPELAV